MQTRRLLLTTLLMAACGPAGAGAASPTDATAHPGETVTVVEPHADPGTPRTRDRNERLSERLLRIDGGLTEAQVRDVVQEHFGQVSHCYDQNLVDADPDVRGAIVVGFDVDASGATSNVALEASEYGDPATERCLVNAVDRWRFPSGTAGRVSYPFYLASF